MESIISLIIRGENQANPALSAVQSGIGSIGSTLQGAASFAIGGLLTTGIQAVTGALGGLFSEMVGGNSAFEQYTTQFEVMLGSTEAAQQRIQELSTFAASTPFELPGVIEAGRVLQGFGLYAADAAAQFGYSGQQILTIAGDVASGTGSSFSEMALLLGKFSAGATGEAISRMQELGITTRAELAAMGLEFSNSGELLSPLPEAMEVVLGLMQDKYGGMMAAQSQTFAGMLSNLADWKSATLRAIGEPIFEVLRDKLSDLLAFLGSPAVQGAISTMAGAFATGLGSIIDIFSTFIGSLGNSSNGIGSFIDQVLPPLQTFGNQIVSLFRDTILPVIQQFGQWFVAEGLPAIQLFAQQVLSQLVPGLQQLGTWLVQISQAGWQVFGNAIKFVQQNFDVILPVMAAVGAAILLLSSPVTLVIGAVTLLATAWANNWGGIQEKTAAAVSFVQNIIQTALTAIQAFWAAHGEQIMTIVNAAMTAIQNTFNTAIAFIGSLVQMGLTMVQTFWAAHGEQVLGLLSTVWETIKGLFSTATAFIGGVIQAFAAAARGDWTAFGEQLRVTIDTAWESIKTIFGNARSDIVQIVAQLVLDILAKFMDTDWAALGANVIDGILAGLNAGYQAVIDFIVAMCVAAVDAIKAYFGISSPSRLMADVFQNVAAGMGVGLAIGSEQVIDQARGIAGQIAEALNANGTINLAVGGNGRGLGGTTTGTAPVSTTINHYHFAAGSFVIQDERTARLLLEFLNGQEGLL